MRSFMVMVLLLMLGALPLQAAKLVGTVNLNTAGVENLVMLPGMDEELAERLVRYRDGNGPFDSLVELINVRGMTFARMDELLPHAVLSGETGIRRIRDYSDALRSMDRFIQLYAEPHPLLDQQGRGM